MKVLFAFISCLTIAAHAQEKEYDYLRGSPFNKKYVHAKSDSVKALWNVDVKKGAANVATDAPRLQIHDDEKLSKTTYIMDEDYLVKLKTPEGHRLVAFTSSSGIVDGISSASYNEKGLTDYTNCEPPGLQTYNPENLRLTCTCS